MKYSKKRLYIFDLGHDNLYKIGTSEKPDKRLKTFQAANPWMTYHTVFKIPHLDIECQIHEWLMGAGVHVNREIFSLTPAEVELVTDHINELGGVEE
jgi:hypothetical protein